MKKIIYIIMVLGLVFTSCDPMDDIHSDLDAKEDIIVGDDIITLTDGDYDELDLDGGFESVDDVKTILPSYLSDLYPVWGKGSSVLVNYNMVGGLTDLGEVSDFINAETYRLTEADYAVSGSNVEGFYPNVDPSDYIEDILDANIQSPEDGATALVKYQQYVEEPVIEITTNYLFADNFNYGATTGDLTTVSEGTWVSHSGTANQLQTGATSLSMDGYPSSNVGGSILLDAFGNEDVNSVFAQKNSGVVYASTLVNLSSVADGTYFFHFKDDQTNYTGRVGAKSDGAGKVLFGIGASSSTLTYGTTAYDLDTTYLLVSTYDIDNGTSNLYVLTSAEATEPATPEATNSGSSGRTVLSIAVRQGWQGPSAILDGIRVATSWEDIMKDDVATTVTGDKTYSDIYYKFNGSYWSSPSNVYNMTSEDYDSMGTASGQPGRYNNFDSNVAPNDYIPTFLSLAHPFAQEEDEIIVMYKYRYNSQTIVRGNLFTVVNGIWTAHASSLQFGHDGSKWVPDNTIKYTFTIADYDSLGEEFGSPGYYNNFDVREGNDNYESPQSILAYINTVLKNNFPNAQEGQKFAVYYDVYSGTSEVWEMRVVLTGGVYVLQ